MKRFIVWYKCGTSPYRYSYDTYAYNAEEAIEIITKYYLPVDAYDITAEEARF